MPCTIPLVPGFLAFLAGTAEEELENKNWKKAKASLMFNSLLFVIGFSSVFILFGVAAGLIGTTLGEYKNILTKISGVIILLFGLFLLDLLKIPKLNKNKSLYIPKFLKPGNSSSSFLFGIAFSFGWSPCIGPILGSILLLASTSSSVLTGALLLMVFSLGLGIPFLALAFLSGSLLPKIKRVNRFLNVFAKIGGVFLVLIGILQFFGKVGYLTSWLINLLPGDLYQQLLNYL